MKNLFKMLAVLTVILVGCKKSDTSVEIKGKAFQSADEYLASPNIKQAISESEITIHQGVNPPELSGDYDTSSKVTDASSLVYDNIYGTPINTQVTLYNQTNSGEINFKETVGGITAMGTGGYVTGDNETFTIWQESEQSGGEAGLPDDLTINVALLISGTKLSNGNLKANGISIITDVSTTSKDYDPKDLQTMKGIWWMYQTDFNLIVSEGKKSAVIPNLSNKNQFPLRQIFTSNIIRKPNLVK
jgi:hypothetical protein